MALVDEGSEQTDRAVTAQDIHADLMARMREGKFLPGQQLPNERQLAEMYGSSRQQVRDALLILQEAGLVRRKVGSGTWLPEDMPQIIERLDAEVDVGAQHEHSFLETVEARLILEPGVAALAARNISETHLERLRVALEAVREPANWMEFKSRIYLFARAYYEASGNSFLLWTFDQILAARIDHKFDGHRENGAVAEIVRRHSHDQLVLIFRAIADGDEARAEAETRRYLIGIAAALS
ncbi:MAG: FadR family transcriptional regulator [Tabrizicola sp.]|nr:FadR family transcriptional regulator [Tabrizicola sp.]